MFTEQATSRGHPPQPLSAARGFMHEDLAVSTESEDEPGFLLHDLSDAEPSSDTASQLSPQVEEGTTSPVVGITTPQRDKKPSKKIGSKDEDESGPRQRPATKAIRAEPPLATAGKRITPDVAQPASPTEDKMGGRTKISGKNSRLDDAGKSVPKVAQLRSAQPTSLRTRPGKTTRHVDLNYSPMIIGFLATVPGINSRSVEGYTALSVAAKYGLRADVERLIQRGADVNQAALGFMPLHFAIVKAHTAILRVLIRNGANVNATGLSGISPLHMATAVDDARLLVGNGADINVVARDGTTPLHQTIMNDRPDVALLLIEHGANVNAATLNGETPLHFAAAATAGRDKLCALLMKFGAHVHCCDKLGHSPVHFASCANHPATAALLLQSGAASAAADALPDFVVAV